MEILELLHKDLVDYVQIGSDQQFIKPLVDSVSLAVFLEGQFFELIKMKLPSYNLVISLRKDRC